MSGSPASTGMNMGNMTMSAGLSPCDVKPMQFPLAQRRKRRVLFTQAQVSQKKERDVKQALKNKFNSNNMFEQISKTITTAERKKYYVILCF